MTWSIVEIENHPDRGVQAVHGPYDSYELADEARKVKEKSPSNFTPSGTRWSDFYVHEMEAP